MLEILLFNSVHGGVALLFTWLWLCQGQEWLEWLPDRLTERVGPEQYEVYCSLGWAVGVLVVAVMGLGLGEIVAGEVASWL